MTMMNTKRRTNRILSILLALLVSMTMFLPASAAVYRYTRADGLFRNFIDGSERQDKVTIKDKNGEDIEVELPLIARATKSNVTVSSNAVVIRELQATVRKGTTLTIDRGVTLTVYGDLVVEGTLVNNGTLVIGDKHTFDIKDEFEKELIDAVRARMKFNQVTVTGTLTNAGTITVREGELAAQSGGIINSSGTISVNNAARNSAGLRAVTLKKGGVTTTGTINNSGTVYVRNTTQTSTGIHVFGGSKFSNTGSILLGKRGTVKGKITGTQPRKE